MDKRWKARRLATAKYLAQVASIKEALGPLKTSTADAPAPLILAFGTANVSSRRSPNGPLSSPTPEELEVEAQLETSLRAPNSQTRSDGDQSSRVLLATVAAREGMNTNVRKSIFTSLVTARDYQEAYARIAGLRLRKQQLLEVPRVLIHCAMSEPKYNHYYSLVAQRLCTEKRLCKGFGFALHAALKGLDHSQKVTSTSTEVRMDGSLLTLARLFAHLVATEALSILILQVNAPPERLSMHARVLDTKSTNRAFV